MAVSKKLSLILIFSFIIGAFSIIFLGKKLKLEIKNIAKLRFDSFYTTYIKTRPRVKINNTEIFVFLARSSREKARGLSGRSKLGEYEGMLFIFENKSYPSFWMKDMNFPIDIIWISDGKIVGIEKNIPNPEPVTDKRTVQEDSQLIRYRPTIGIDYVLEVNAGFSEKNMLKVGDNVNLVNLTSK